MGDAIGIRCVAQNDGEFVAAQPAAQFVVGHQLAQPFGNEREQLVAHKMPQRIVDGLETIEVDHQERATRTPLVGVRHRFAQRVGHHHPVGQTGQCIVAGEIGDLLGAFALFGHVRTHAAEAGETTVLVDLGGRGQFPPPVASIDGDADDEVGEAFPPLQAFRQIVQAGMELPAIPRRPGDQLDQGLAISLVRLAAEREGKTRRCGADPAGRIDLPQPVRPAFLEFAQQERDHLALFGHACFGHARV
jgi:hypothetical protein